jgi:nickel-dependent lactate racemase
MVDEQGRAEKVFAGHWQTAHRRACEEYLSTHSQTISEKRDLVIVSCGGSPYDINMIQAHKALDMAAHACSDGGTIVFLAECADGLGRDDFMKWFDAPDSRALEIRLREGYEVNGQTAWALMTKAETFRVQIITNLDNEQCSRMRMNPVQSINEVLANLAPNARGYILPRGAALLPVTRSTQSTTA